jgi:hypothetical protein
MMLDRADFADGSTCRCCGIALTPDKPDHNPSTRLAVWLSSEDVLDAISKLAETGTDKAACWDMTQAIREMSKGLMSK